MGLGLWQVSQHRVGGGVGCAIGSATGADNRCDSPVGVTLVPAPPGGGAGVFAGAFGWTFPAGWWGAKAHPTLREAGYLGLGWRRIRASCRRLVRFEEAVAGRL